MVAKTLRHFAGLKKLLGSTLTPKNRAARGTVKWFSNQKGYGFIELEDGGKDVFVHHSEVQTAGLRKLHRGQKVAFDVVPDEKGPKAVNLTKA